MKDRWIKWGALLIVVIVLAALVALLVPPLLAAQTKASNGAVPLRSITVIGEGSARAAPDVAEVTVGVETTSPTIKDAAAGTATTMEAVMVALREGGVAESDIRTTGFSVWTERPVGPDGQQSADPIYRVQNTVNVIIRDREKVGAALDAAMGAGANTVWGVTFSISNQTELAVEARQLAMADAQKKAQEVASLASVQLGQIQSVTMIGYGGGFGVGAPREALGGGGEGPISPGQLEVTAQLQVVYLIQ